MKRGLIFVLLIGIALTACAPSTQRTVSVTGSGGVALTPDIAYISIGVETRYPAASVATAENNMKMEAVISELLLNGVLHDDIQTREFNIYTYQEYNENSEPVTIYIVSNNAYVTVRNIDNVGNLLDVAIVAGANIINFVSFGVEDKTEALSTARLAAVEDARNQAEQLASATGDTLGRVITMVYYDTSSSPMYAVSREDISGASVPFEAGEVEITTSVSVVYELK